MICNDCHWYTEEGASKPCSNGKIYPCSNIGVPGWDFWNDNQKAPEECRDYCKIGEYVPTGVWADIAKVVRATAALFDDKESETKC